MRIIEGIYDMKAIIKSQKGMGKSIGFVPTMGYLHDGHLSLIRSCKNENDFTIVSIFVNPTQFGENEDYDRYPRDFNKDTILCQEEGVDVIFSPSIEEMYPTGYNTFVNVETITDILCGASRPGHFRGVTTIVTKLFNIISPDRAYFGQKDAQQVSVISKMVKDLNLGIDIITCPIIREADGLALSSRNVYLSENERLNATSISKALFLVQNNIKQGERSIENIKNTIAEMVSIENISQIDYVEIVNADNLGKIEELAGNVLIAIAVRFGKTRLIDNIVVRVES